VGRNSPNFAPREKEKIFSEAKIMSPFQSRASSAYRQTVSTPLHEGAQNTVGGVLRTFAKPRGFMSGGSAITTG
jgi:hypothetical protein